MSDDATESPAWMLLPTSMHDMHKQASDILGKEKHLTGSGCPGRSSAAR
jgi:hypothetical protein